MGSKGVPKGFRWGFRGVPRVSGGFRRVFNRNLSCKVMVFPRPGVTGLGFPAASAYPNYNIKRVDEPSAVVVGTGAVVTAPGVRVLEF